LTPTPTNTHHADGDLFADEYAHAHGTHTPTYTPTPTDVPGVRDIAAVQVYVSRGRSWQAGASRWLEVIRAMWGHCRRNRF
jgi:hypothetical protein